MRIWRYQLQITDRQTVRMPFGYTLLSVAPGRPTPAVIGYNHHIDLWVQVPVRADPGAGEFTEVPVDIQIMGTGYSMPQVPLAFIGTVVMPNELVWHVFERT